MTTPYDQRLEDLTKLYRQQRADLGRIQQEIDEITATAIAGQQAVVVTVDAKGDILDLSFPNGAYRRMAPTELASVLTSTIQKARADAAAQSREILVKYQPEGGVLDLVNGTDNWLDLLPEEPPTIDPFDASVWQKPAAPDDRW